jgi:UDP-N-acetylmuramoyl-L-alanyl-D-glutamate--2,6-diaminopimelate ligase
MDTKETISLKLQELLAGVEILETGGSLPVEITGVSYDSRTVQPGDLFVAISGYAADGHRFIPAAVKAGAACVLCEQAPTDGTPYLRVASTRTALAQLGANWYGHPAEQMTMIGVTGTNGKTTVTYLLKSVLEQTLNAKVGLIGTIQNMIGDEILPTERTTPESFELQGLFRQMLDAGCTHVVMEVSSHALVLDRVATVHFDTGIFTNLTQDHLDFHKTMDAYCDAKAMLFSRCDKGVINLDDAYAPRILAAATCQTITCSEEKNEANLVAKNIRLRSDRTEFEMLAGNELCRIEIGIPGRFTVYNAMSVIGAALGLGIPLTQIAAALKNAKGVKGRVEVVPTPGTDYTVLIDYAHTPDGLENVLRSVKGFCRGRTIAVFGCGGDRDPIKRPIMGKIAADLADFVVVTSDNPRTEDPNAIIAQILEGMKETTTPYYVEADRPTAIRWAMDHAQKDDIIVLAGKGHETYQIRGTVKYHLDEREEVAAHLEETKAKECAK